MRRALLALALFLTLLVATPTSAKAAEGASNVGVGVGVGSGPAPATTPRRIVSLAPNITETLYALDLGGSIVGVTDFCDFPSQAKQQPKIGGMTNPSLEAVARLRPDIVIMTTDGNPEGFKKKLDALKIKVHVFRARRLSELPGAIRTLGNALDAGVKAEALASGIEEATRSIKKRAQGRRPHSALFIIWAEPLIVAGPGTSIDDAMELLGLVNIAGDARSPWPRFSLEEVLRRSPEIIFTGDMRPDSSPGPGPTGTAETPSTFEEKFLKRISSVEAVKKKRVYYLGDALFRIGPRTISGILEMEGKLDGL